MNTPTDNTAWLDEALDIVYDAGYKQANNHAIGKGSNTITSDSIYRAKQAILTHIDTVCREAVADWWRGRTVPFRTFDKVDYVPLTWVEEQTRFMSAAQTPLLNPNKDTTQEGN